MKKRFLFLVPYIYFSGLMWAQDGEALVGRIMERQEQLFSALFTQTGFETYEAFCKNIKKKCKERVESFDNDAVLAIFSPSSVRSKILKKGFKNQYETKTSRGLLDKDARFNTERSLLNYTAKEYGKVAKSLRPKYGIVATFKQIADLMENNFPYGDDVFLLKSHIKNRVTWTPGDSLNRVHARSNECICACSAWDQIFIPWKYVYAAVPYMGKTEQGMICIPDIETIDPGEEMNVIMGSRTHIEYVEIQIWGEVTIYDVEYFMYNRMKPKKKQLKAAEKAGVAVLSLESLRAQPAAD